MFAATRAVRRRVVCLVGRDIGMSRSLAADEPARHGGLAHAWQALRAAWPHVAVVGG